MDNNGSLHIPEKQAFPAQVSWRKSLRFRLTLIFIIVQVLLGGVTMLGLSNIYQTRIEIEYMDKATIISKFIASLFDGEMIDWYLETLEADEEYARLLDIMRKTKEDADAEYIYISRIVEEGELFVFDTEDFDLGILASFDEYDYEYEAKMDLIPRLMHGGRIEPYVTNTDEWGWLLTVYEPIYRADGSVAAHVGVDISMDGIVRERTNVFMLIGLIILLIFFVSVAVNLFAVQRYLISPVRMLVSDVSAYSPDNKKLVSKLRSGDELAHLERAMIDMEARIDKAMADLKDAEELTKLMVNTYPLSCHIFNSLHELIDCNEAALELFGIGSRYEYLARFFELMPEYQPDGRLSLEKADVFLKKAFDDGSVRFEWMHRLTDGSPLPAEITLVRVNRGADALIVSYTRDLRDIEKMENKILQLEAEVDKIYYDALTGIYNRRYFDRQLERTVKSLSRSKDGTLSLMMIDIDKFKDYNDTYGHSEGDKCLKIVAETIAQTVTREDDFAVRYGGEEFAVVLPNTDEAGARVMADKILENIIRRNIPHEKNTASAFVTVSIGVATGEADYAQPMEYYIKAADELLYQSKQDGRNRYTFGTF